MNNSQLIVSEIAKRFGTYDPSKYQIQRRSYYDYVRYPVTGTTELSFFTNPTGSTDPVSGLAKTEEQTNIRRANEFDEHFIIMQIRTHLDLLPIQRQASAIQAVTTAVVNGYSVALQNSINSLSGLGVLLVTFGQKLFQDIEQPFRFCPVGAGVRVTNISSTDTGAFPIQSLWTRQSVSPKDVYANTPPNFVEKNQTMQVRIVFPNGASTALPQVAGADVRLNVGVLFDGFIIRPVQ